jgi:xylulokinase
MLLVIDMGTSTFKAALVRYDGTGGKLVRLPFAPDVPVLAAAPTAPEGSAPAAVPLDGLRHETDPAQWLRAVGEAAARLGPRGEVEAVIISGNGPTLTPVTGTPGLWGGELALPSGAALNWLDRRAGEEARLVSGLMGGFVDPSFFLPKALWIKNHAPELYEKTRWFLAAPEFLVYALTGEARTVFPSPGFDRWYWNDRVLDAAALDREKFPPLLYPGDTIGTLSPAVASRFGFSPEVKVIAGGPDFFVSILGTGAIRPGMVCDRSGTSEGINLCVPRRIDDSRLMCYGHPVKPHWNLSGIISSTGRAIAWGRELLGLEQLPHAAFYDLAAEAPAGAGGLVFLPYLAGERAPIWDPHAQGVFAGLRLETGRAALARAVAEGVCLAIRDVVTVMEETGVPVEELRATGGPSESPFLNQLKADVTGRPVLIPGPRERPVGTLSGAPAGTASSPTQFPAELTGLAILGAAAMGAYGSAGEAADALVGIVRTFVPDEKKAPVYDRAFAAYRDIYQSLKHMGTSKN